MITKYFKRFLFFLFAAGMLAITLISPAGCNKNGSDVNFTISLTDTVYKALNNQAGGYVYVTNDGISVIVVRLSTGAANPFVALSSACTRDQCTVVYNTTGNYLQCNCCGSIYKTSGEVASGPAPSPLTSYYVFVSGNDLTVASNAPCTIPVGITTTAITASTATLEWYAVTGASGYDLQYRQVGASSWTTKSLTGSTYTLVGLDSGTDYEWQVETNCSGSNSQYSSTHTFTTSK